MSYVHPQDSKLVILQNMLLEQYSALSLWFDEDSNVRLCGLKYNQQSCKQLRRLEHTTTDENGYKGSFVLKNLLRISWLSIDCVEPEYHWQPSYMQIECLGNNESSNVGSSLPIPRTQRKRIEFIIQAVKVEAFHCLNIILGFLDNPYE